MELQQLRYVVAVTEERGFTRAAQRLRVAQPSVSAQVKALEEELGAELFVRARSGATLTGAGEVFLPWARQVLADIEAGRAGVRELLGLRRGRLALGATPSLATAVLPTVLTTFRERYPGVDLSLRQAGSRDLVSGVADGTLDLALLILPVRDRRVATRALAEEELVLAVPRTHALARRRTVTVADLRDLPLIVTREGYDVREVTLTMCRAAGFEPTLALEGGEMDGVLALAAAGLGAAVVPSIVVDPDGPLVALRFTGDIAPTRAIGLGEGRDRPRSSAAAAFARELSAVMAHGWPGAPRVGLRVLG
ncbi:MAG TPA: LysR substrate-binding domain-containing protein [Mycobacteriales bacterium]|nr:LysR substrate-binding domain-containing protein [Mycobacteriales bacterium]